MTNKVQKIREEVEKLKLCTMDEHMKFYSDAAEAEYNALCEVEKIIDSLQEEPVSNPVDFEKELYKAFGQVKDFTLGMRIAKWFYEMGKNSQEPVSDDLVEAAITAADEDMQGRQIMEESNENRQLYSRIFRRGFKAGAKWQKQQLWKSADGDDLPEIGREVIVLIDNGKVVFAHRPDPKGWDAKSIITEKVEHYIPKTYGEGGWNIPNIVYWLDIELPKEI